MEIKIKMHTLLNRIAFWLLFPMFAVGGAFICKDAASDQWRVIGVCLLLILFIFVVWYFVFKLCVYDYAIFKEEGVGLYSPFKKKAFFAYEELIACLAYYTSIIERKKYVTFINRKYNSVVTKIDTSSGGNTVLVNKMRVIYVPWSERLMEFLKEKPSLQWYKNS